MTPSFPHPTSKLYNASQERSDKLSAEVGELETQVSQEMRKRKGVETRMMALEKSEAALRSKAETQEAMDSERQDRLEELHAQLAESQDRASGLALAKADLEEKLWTQSKSATVPAMQASADSELQERVEELQAQLMESQERAAELALTKSDLEEQLGAQRESSAGPGAGDLSVLEARLEEMERELSTAKDLATSAESARATMEQAVADATQRAEDAENEVSSIP